MTIDNSVVYFIEDLDNHRIKIGSTKNIENRIQAIRTNNSSAIRLIGTISFPSSVVFDKEKMFHLYWVESKAYREWYNITKAQIEALCLSLNYILTTPSDDEQNDDSEDDMIECLMKRFSGMNIATKEFNKIYREECFQLKKKPLPIRSLGAIIIDNGVTKSNVDGRISYKFPDSL